jgi:hypothetical protein
VRRTPDPGDGVKEHPRVRHANVVEERLGGRLLDDPAGVHDEHPVHELRDDPEVMGKYVNSRLQNVLAIGIVGFLVVMTALYGLTVAFPGI